MFFLTFRESTYCTPPIINRYAIKKANSPLRVKTYIFPLLKCKIDFSGFFFEGRVREKAREREREREKKERIREKNKS